MQVKMILSDKTWCAVDGIKHNQLFTHLVPEIPVRFLVFKSMHLSFGIHYVNMNFGLQDIAKKPSIFNAREQTHSTGWAESKC